MRAASKHGGGLALAGALLQIGLCIALHKLWPAITTLHASGIGDPVPLLTGWFEEALPYVSIELTAAFVGLVMLCLALTGSRYRAGWFFWFLVVYGAVLVPIFPVGTAFGGFFLFYCLSRRREFHRAAQ